MPKHAPPDRPASLPRAGRETVKSKHIIDDLKLKARKHTDAAINTLVDLLDNKNATARLHAAQALLDRGWGKTAVMADDQRSPDTAIKVLFTTPPPVIEAPQPQLLTIRETEYETED